MRRPFPSAPLFLILSLAIAIPACKRREAAAPSPPTPTTAAVPQAITPGSPGPLTYENSNAFAHVKLSLPQIITATPDLQATLYSDGVRDLREFVEGAQADRTEYEGSRDMPPYEKEIVWTPGGSGGRLVSYQARAYEFSGGAHPNTTFTAVLFDTRARRAVDASGLLKPGADTAVLDRTLCEAVRAAKRARLGAAYTPDETTWPCPKWKDVPWVLAPSILAGKAGGVTFLFDAYAIGAYAEGPYWITVPVDAFQAQLNPAWAEVFDGRPARVGDVTPTK